MVPFEPSAREEDSLRMVSSTSNRPVMKSIDRENAVGSEETQAKVAQVDSLPFKSFVWGAGLECSFIPHLNVDQYQWTQHNRFWRQDLKRAKEELGINTLRYAFPWHQIEREPGQFDWTI